jgi:hypothetical protein
MNPKCYKSANLKQGVSEHMEMTLSPDDEDVNRSEP